MPPDAIQDALDSAAQWEWVELTTASSNAVNDVQAPRTKAVFDKDGVGGSTYANDAAVLQFVQNAMPNILAAWGGIALGTGTYKQFIWLCGGGHGDGGDNSVFRVDMSGAYPVITRLTDPNPHGTTQSPDYPTQAGTQPYYTWPTVVSDLQTAGQIGPVATHTYDAFIFDPTRQCLYLSVSTMYANSGGMPVLWKFDLTTNTWSHVVTASQMPATWDGSFWFVPGDTDNLYSQASSGGYLYRYDIDADSVVVASRYWSGSGGGENNGCIIPSFDGTPGVWDFVVCNNAGTNMTVFPSINSGTWNQSYGIASFTGDTRAFGANSHWCRREGVDDLVYSFNSALGSLQTLEFDPANKPAVNITDIATTGVTIEETPGSTGNTGRIKYMPDYDAFAFVSGANPNVYLLKAAAGSGGSVSLSPAAGEAAADGGTPGADAGANLTPASGAAAADGGMPGLDAGVSLSPGAGEASADGGTPGLEAGGSVSLTPGGGDAAADGGAPDVDAGVSPAPGPGDASGDGGNAGFAGGHSLAPGAGDAAADGGVPSLGDPATAPGRMTLHETPVAWMTLHETPAAAT